MKQIENNSLENAKKKFYRSIIILIIAIIYLISPIDLIPGAPPFEWIEDIPILIIASIYTGYSYFKLKKEQRNKSD